MYKRTFEVLAKYISKENKVTLQFDSNEGAHADMTNNVLHLPTTIASSHAYAALALMMHESAHIRCSKIIPIKEIVKTASEFNILNAIEDVRIDLLNFQRLPNIFTFYEELIKEVKVNSQNPNIDLPTKALCWAILRIEQFRPKGMFGMAAQMLGDQIINDMEQGVSQINFRYWAELRKTILKIKETLKIPPEPELPPEQIAKLQMGGNVPGPVDTKSVLQPSAVFSKGQSNDMGGGSSGQIGNIAMEDQFVTQFKEILNVKERKLVDNGSRLDADSLISFKTGDVGELFKEEKVIKKKKSKISFLLDSSSSMRSPLIDGVEACIVVSKSVKKLTEILDEVSSLEGLNVDWAVGMFKNNYYPLNKDTWQKEYTIGGGTQFAHPFLQVMNEMLGDYTIDGKKIIIAFTDGDVADQEIEDIKEAIITNFNDVRALIIGVGSAGGSMLVKEITGDNIIHVEADAVTVIIETIKALL